ncbi:substrate-binding domain-containing protein [Prosthecobacter sp.]|uniref:substrate-binding domain-containing protein n=1 Tax=Prosthecobacter sp. TaxID=1965333 RepID=UPI003784A6B2
MSRASSQHHPVAVRRKALGWSQDDLSARAGVPRSSVSAIEAGRLTPSVTAALAVAQALECSVEELFDPGGKTLAGGALWAWKPRMDSGRYWEAEVGGRKWLYPVETLSGSTWAHDGIWRDEVLHERSDWDVARTLVLAGCDPAAGLLAAEYAAASGFRLLAFTRGGGAALDLLKQGVVHVAALHRSTEEKPQRNSETVREKLGGGYRLLRSADWQEGIALPPGDTTQSVTACARHVRQWAMREPGSAARECLDDLLGKPQAARRLMLSHQAVVEAVRGGWAEAGVCVRLCAEDAGLRFLPVRKESLDLCFPAAMERDPRLQALIRLLRSRAHRRLIDELPGYDASRTGELATV